MALTEADVNKVAERVLDLAKERSERAYEEWKAEREAKASSPEGLAERVKKLEHGSMTWASFYTMVIVVCLLMAVFPSPSPKTHGSSCTHG